MEFDFSNGEDCVLAKFYLQEFSLQLCVTSSVAKTVEKERGFKGEREEEEGRLTIRKGRQAIEKERAKQ